MPFAVRFIYFNRFHYHKEFDMVDQNKKGDCCVCMESANIPLMRGEGQDDYLCAVLKVSKLDKQDLYSNYICKSCLVKVMSAYDFNIECVLANRILDLQTSLPNNNH